nr:uncharacterized protein LOC104107501 [Nicotiana tomentosiformis]
MAPSTSHAGGGAQTPTTHTLEQMVHGYQTLGVLPAGVVQPIIAARPEGREEREIKKPRSTGGFSGASSGGKGYYSRRHHARLVRSALQITQWYDKCEQSYQKLKLALTTTPVLMLPMDSRQYTVYYDAFHLIFGAVLMQDGMVIAYTS